jgi:UV DNA damage endonuclease
MFDLMGFNALEAPLILHAGGRYDDPLAAAERLVRTLDGLPAFVHARLCLENDDRLWSAAEVIDLCARSGVRMVWDQHHHICHNPEDVPAGEALAAALATWPDASTPKIHLSSGRTAPDDRAHAEHIASADWMLLVELLSQVERDVDVMIEAKAKDHAVLDLAQRIRSGELARPPQLDIGDLPAWP